jgi:uncharacterized protein (TIGR02145 family)
MKPLHRILSFLLIGIFLLACEEEQQTWLSEMEGTPDCTVPAVIGKKLPVTITAGGITTPGNVAYTWDAPDFSPSTFTGAAFEATSPDVAGEYHIFITAHSAGYRDVTKKKKVVVLDCIPMQGQLDIAAPAEIFKEEPIQFTATGITAPADVTYHWRTDFSPETCTDAVFNVEKAPKDPGSYTIFITAKAESYCDTSFQKTILVKPGRKMQGMFDITIISHPVIKGQEVTFAANGITTPTDGLTYKWLAEKFAAGTASGNSYTTTCPPSAGTYMVTVTASAPGYADSTARREISVSDELPMDGSISISVPPEEIIKAQEATFYITSSISTPKEGVSFVWDAPHFTPSTYQSADNAFTATLPGTPGDYVITVRARATNYSDMAASVTVTVKGGKDMTGTLDFNIPEQIVSGLEATFSISSSLATDETAPITYEWTAPTFAPATFSGSTFSGVPAAAGTRTITLLAKADGYTPRSKSKQVDVIAGLDMGALNIQASSGTFMAGGDNITFTPSLTPPQNATYTWSAPGCTPETYTGESYKPKLPSTPGTYKVALNVQATGYNPKGASFDYTIDCNPMTVTFNLSRTELLVNDRTVLSVIPPSPPVPGISYTWTIPAGFTIVGGNSTATSVTIQAPASNPPAQPVPLTLTAKATNYCEATHTATVTVVSCYPATITPPTVIAPPVDKIDEIFHVPNLHEVEFSTTAITSLPLGTEVQYEWKLDGFTPSSLTGNNTTFGTKAPAYDNNRTYTLTLQPIAENYCPFPIVYEKVVVDASTNPLQGTVEIITGAVAPSSPSTAAPVVWLVKDHATTLVASYNYMDGENANNIKLKYKWHWLNENGLIVYSDENDGTLVSFTPGTVTGREGLENHKLLIEAYDLNGRAGVSSTYSLVVKECAGHSLPGFYADVNYQCGGDGKGVYAYVKDKTGESNTFAYYQVRKFGGENGKWWFTENLRKKVAGAAVITNSAATATPYGYYYQGNLITDLAKSSGEYCPPGWRIPDETEWRSLSTAVGESNNATGVFTKLTSQAAGDGSWRWSSDVNGTGTNAYGFTLVPAGHYNDPPSDSSSPSNEGKVAEFFVKDSAKIQRYGSLEEGAGTINSTVDRNNNYYYTVRCINE